MKIKSENVLHSLRPFKAEFLVFGFFFFWPVLNLAAQNGRAQESDLRSAESAQIYYAEGMGFAVSLGGEQLVFPAGTAGKDGIYLERSAVVNTGVGSFVEIQLIPSGTVIKLSENTSLAYNGFDETGRFTDFGLLYGRIRVVAGEGNNSFGAYAERASSVGVNTLGIRCGAVSTRIGEGDFGFDYILEPGNKSSVQRPLFRLFAFRGNADVYPYGGGTPANFGVAESLTVTEGETLSLDVSSSYAFAERKALDMDIVTYWRLHNFAGIPPLPRPDINLAIRSAAYYAPPEIVISEESPPVISAAPLPKSQPLVPLQPEETHAPPEIRRAKNTLLVLGLGMTLISMTVQGGAYYQYNKTNNSVPRKLFTYAYIPLGFGVMSTLIGILYNPSGR